MDAEQLKALQMPFKTRYREQPETAAVKLSARGSLDAEGIVCKVKTHESEVLAGLHPSTGGDGLSACSAEMLLEALVGCAGVTLRAVATALSIPLKGGTITAEGDLDVRGTLGVSKETPVGLSEIRLAFALDADASEEQLIRLIGLTERYCVVFQTLKNPPRIEIVPAVK